MRILLLGQHFAPESVSGAVLATQLVEDMVERGHDVSFATCFPNYPGGVVFDSYQGQVFGSETLAGATILRAWSYTSPQKTIFHRLLNYGSFSAIVFFAGLAAGRPDVIMSFSPPLPLGLTAWLLSQLWHVPWVLRVEDLFPEAAVSVGVIRNPSVIWGLEALERFLYRAATHISVISEGFHGKLLVKGVPAEKISVIPVWADPDEIRPLPKQASFRRELGFTNEFLILYAGNMGYTCALEDVLDAALLLKDDSRIHFVLVGEGAKKATLVEMARARRLPNVTFLPFQPRARYPELLASADVALVTLNADSSTTSLPGKTFSYLASGRPIIAVVPLDSELARLVQEACCGIVAPIGQPDALVVAIRSLEADEALQAEMSQNSRTTLEKHFSRQRCVDLYEQMLHQVVGCP